MKYRIPLLALTLLAWSIFAHVIFSPVAVLARNAAAVASVANSDTAFLLQRSVENAYAYPVTAFGYLAIVLAFYLPLSQKQSHEKNKTVGR